MAEPIVELKQKLTDIVQSKDPLDAILLYDGSISISADDFNRGKRAGGTLVWKFGDHVNIGVGQFAKTFREECSLTDQRKESAFAVQSMIQMNGSTAMHLALDGILRMFNTDSRSDAQKFLIIFTDGLPDDKPLALRKAELVKSEGITIIGIGIGDVDQQYLRSIASADCAFSVDSYADLLKQLPTTATSRSRKGIANSEINTVLNLVGEPIAFIGANTPPKLELKVEITNNGQVPIERGSRITIMDEQKQPFFRKRVVPITVAIPGDGKSMEFNVTVDVCAGATIANIPKFLKVVITNPKNVEYWNEAPESYLPIEYFVGDMIQWNPSNLNVMQVANILFFGWNGSGKSTFINKGLSMMTKGLVRASTVRYGNQSTTISVNKFRLDGAKVNLFDSPGVSMDLYNRGEFAFLTSGILPDDWSIDRATEEPMVHIDPEQLRQKKIHSIVFVYPINSLDDTNGMNKMRQFIDNAIRYQHYQPILVLTFGDYVPASDHPARRLKAHRELGIVEADIYIIDNSDKNDDKDTYVYRTVYEVIHKAMKYAEERLKRYPEA